MRPRRPDLAVLGALVLALVSGCAAGGAPRYGTITFHDPVPRRGMRRTRVTPITISYESRSPTKTEKERGENAPGVAGLTGSRGWDPNAELAAEELLRRREMRAGNITRIVPVNMSESQFTSLWSRLEAVGLFALPRYPGKNPPERQPYFLLESTRERWIFVRPDDSNLQLLSPDELQNIEAWRRAKEVIVTGS